MHLRELFCFIKGRKTKKTLIIQSEKVLSQETTEMKSKTYLALEEDVGVSVEGEGEEEGKPLECDL